MPTEIKSTIQFDEEIVNRKDGKLVVVDFYAVWCGPCKQVAPLFEQMSTEYTNIAFYKVNSDNLDTITGRYGVSSLPTFLFLRDGQVCHKIVGADVPQLTEYLKDNNSSTTLTREEANSASIKDLRTRLRKLNVPLDKIANCIEKSELVDLLIASQK